MTRTLVVIAVASLIAASSCTAGSDDPEQTVPEPVTLPAAQPTSTTASITTSTHSSHVTAGQPTPTPTMPDADGGAVLVAGRDGLVIHEGGDQWVLHETPHPVRLAYPDHRGGAVYQLDVLSDAPILALGAGATEPTVLVPHEGGVRPWLHNVAHIDGSPTLIYVASYSICDVTIDCEGMAPALDLVIMDLETGVVDNLGVLGSWDTSVRSTSFGGGVFAHSWASELDFPFVRFSDLSGNHVQHRGLCDVDQSADHAFVCQHVAITPDGARLATLGDPCFVGPWSDAETESCPPEVRVFDVASGELTAWVPVGTGDHSPLWIDANGSQIVATTTGGAWIISPDAAIIDQITAAPGDGGRAVLWRGPKLTQPPHLAITDPPHKGVVATATYTFRGTTDPDSNVSVGDRYYATVHDDGAWELDLTLPIGRSSTTVTATNPDSGASTSESIRVYYIPAGALVLEPDGLGIVTRGDPADDVVDRLSDVLGTPDLDETIHREEVDAPPGGACAGGYACWERVRRATWNDLLTVYFSDLWWEPGIDWPYPEVPMSMVAYWASTPGPMTPEGVGVGSTVADLAAAYGARLTTATDPDQGPYFTVILDGSEHWSGGAGLHGFLDGEPEDPSSRVISITAGSASSW